MTPAALYARMQVSLTLTLTLTLTLALIQTLTLALILARTPTLTLAVNRAVAPTLAPTPTPTPTNQDSSSLEDGGKVGPTKPEVVDLNVKEDKLGSEVCPPCDPELEDGVDWGAPEEVRGGDRARVRGRVSARCRDRAWRTGWTEARRRRYPNPHPPPHPHPHPNPHPHPTPKQEGLYLVDLSALQFVLINAYKVWGYTPTP